MVKKDLTKVALFIGVGAVFGTNVGWYYALKESGFQQSLFLEKQSYMLVGGIAGAIAGGVIGYLVSEK